MSSFNDGFENTEGSYINVQDHSKVTTNIELLKNSRKARKFLEQMTKKQSIMHQIDVQNEIKNYHEALKLANFDDLSIPQQIWYN